MIQHSLVGAENLAFCPLLNPLAARHGSRTADHPLAPDLDIATTTKRHLAYAPSQDLRRRLEASGHCYRSRSDTETIVHLYEEHGRNSVQHLRGMFAFALWDAKHRRLFVARDRLGIKPLYYVKTPTAFLFASEIKALLETPYLRPELNRAALPEYLAFGYLAGDETLFAGVRKLQPGHTLVVDETGQLIIEPYWDLPLPADSESRPKSYYIRTYRELLEETVESHLMSDVPLGVFLSGGVDSSAIAALMTKIRGEPVQSFSVGYKEEAYSELQYAEAVANHLGTEHHSIRVTWQEFLDALPRLIWHEDGPLAWPSSVSLYFVARLAREHVRVVLTGEGSDETLAGYGRYAWTLWNRRLDRIFRVCVPATMRRFLREAMAESPLLTGGLRRKLQHTFLGRDGASWASFYFDNFYSAFSEGDQAALLSDRVPTTPGVAYRQSLAYWNKSRGDILSRLLYTDIKTYLVELLKKQDKMSMAASVESRVPFLDHCLVEFTAQIPASLKVRGLTSKYILKEAVRDLLPESILFRRKMGFPTPWSHWLAGSHLNEVENILLDPGSISRQLFRQEALRTLFAQHRARYRDHADRLWRLLNLEIWQRVFLD